MSKVSIDYSVNDLVFRSRQLHISWISQDDSVEWQTIDAPSIYPTGVLADWVIFESILKNLNNLLSVNNHQYENFRYFRDLIANLSPDTEVNRSNQLRTQIECRLPDEFLDLEFKLLNSESDYLLTDLTKFYLYFSLHLPKIIFPIIGDHCATVQVSKQGELLEQIEIPTAIESRWLNWKSTTASADQAFVKKIKNGFQIENDDPWFYIENGYDLHILSSRYWTLWISGELSEWEIALIVTSLLQEIYPVSNQFEENLNYINQKCSLWQGSRVEVKLA